MVHLRFCQFTELAKNVYAEPILKVLMTITVKFDPVYGAWTEGITPYVTFAAFRKASDGI